MVWGETKKAGENLPFAFISKYELSHFQVIHT